MLLYTSLTFYDEFSVLLLRFFPQFCLILHLLDPAPAPGSQSNADLMQIWILIRYTASHAGTQTVPVYIFYSMCMVPANTSD
jgi:hypothetical protein